MSKYTPFEIDMILETMTVFVDTREQPNTAYKRRMAGIGFPVVRRFLNFGDYSCKVTGLDGIEIDFSDRIVIERKYNLNETAMCFTRERSRFTKEFERIKAANAKAFLLIEDDNWNDAYTGLYGDSERYRSRLNPKAMTASLHAFCARYGVHIQFCNHKYTGQMIRDILYYEVKEWLAAQ